MRRSRAVLLSPGLIALAIVGGAPAAPDAQSPGRFHLVRSTSGSRGAPEGSRFVMEDPRVEFQAGTDRQVLVVFEWQGPIGHHHCEGTWKDPSGRAVFTSQSEVDARVPRFGVYWGLSLPDTVATGNWIVEARIDGEPAGVHAFQILTNPVAASAPVARSLSLAELYQRGLEHTLTLDVLGAGGGRLARTSGFFLTPTLVLTSFSGINAAHGVRLLAPGTSPAETNEIVSWNRREDWAILRFAGAGNQPPTRTTAPLQVGDRCFFLDAQGEGTGRVILETAIVGRTGEGDLFLGEGAGEASLGGPVLNEYGEVVAMLAGSRVLGGTPLDGAETRTAPVRGTRARPVPAPPQEDAAARTLDDLVKTGVFVPLVVHTPHFVSGVMGTGIEWQGRIPIARDQRFQFTRGDRQCVVFMTWVPASKEDAISVFGLYDADNHRLAASEERKLKMRPSQSFVQWWEIALGPLKPGVYRVDATKNGDPVWRTFFRLTD